MHVGSDSDGERDARRGFTRLAHPRRNVALRRASRHRQVQKRRRVAGDDAKRVRVKGKRAGTRGM